MLRRQHPELITPVTNEKITKACAGGWVSYQDTAVWKIMACPRLAQGLVDGRSVGSILDQDRLVPGERFSERQRRLGPARAAGS